MRALVFGALGLAALCACDHDIAGLTPTEADIHVWPTELDFSDTVVHAAVTKTVTVQNLGNAAGQVTVSAPVGAAASLYDVSPLGSFTLAGGNQATIAVTYAPNQVSSYDRAAFAIQGPGTPAAITLTGSAGIAGLQITPDPLDFDFVEAGQTVARMLTLKNAGTVSYNFGTLAIAEDDLDGGPPVFSVAPTFLGVIAAGESVDVSVTFAPPPCVGRKYTASWVVDGQEASMGSQIVGYSTSVAITCSAIPINLGHCPSGNTATFPVTCTNTGTDVLGSDGGWNEAGPWIVSPPGACQVAGPDAGSVPTGSSFLVDITCPCDCYDAGVTVSLGSMCGTLLTLTIANPCP